MRILLTGFGAFPGVVDNPSARVVERLAALFAGKGKEAHVLPVSFARTAALLPDLLVRGEPFDAALLLGLAVRDHAFRLERFARNRHAAATPDLDGFTPCEGPIHEAAPDFYETTAPVSRTLAALQRGGIPARISEDAGGYVCNHVYFTALHALAEAGRPTRCLFLHMPPLSESLPIERHITAARLVLESLCTDAW